MASKNSRSLFFTLIFSKILFFSSFAFAYPNVKNLDEFWTQRQSSEGQKAILNFISAGETIPENFDIAWRVARLVYFAGNFGAGYDTFKKEQKVEIFKYGYIAADIARKTEPKRVEGHYWYGVNLGSFGLAKGKLAALGHAEEALNSLLTSADIDPTYHWGGPYRVLGRFYQEVPSFISFGDTKKAEEYFNKAIKIAPDYRLNTINLGVLKKEEGERQTALELLEKARLKPKVDGNLEENRYLLELDKGIATLKEEEE